MSFFTKAITAARDVGESVGGIKEYTKKFATLEKDAAQIQKERLREVEAMDQKGGTKKKKGLGGKAVSESASGSQVDTCSSAATDSVRAESPAPVTPVEGQLETTATNDGWDYSPGVMSQDEEDIPSDHQVNVEKQAAPDVILTNDSEAHLWNALLAVGKACNTSHDDPQALSEAVCQYVQDLQQVNAKMKKQLETAEQKLQELTSAIQQNEAKSKELAQRYELKCQEAEDLRIKSQNLLKSVEEGNAAKLQDMVASSKEEQAQQNATIEQLQNRLKALETQLQSEQQERSSLSPKLAVAEQLATELQTRLHAAEEQANQMKGLLEERTVQLERLTVRLGEAMQVQSSADNLLKATVRISEGFKSIINTQDKTLQERQCALKEQEQECKSQFDMEEERMEQLKIKLKGDQNKDTKAKYRSEIIAILQRRLANLKSDLTSAQKQNEALEKNLELMRRQGHLLGADAPEDGPDGEGVAKADKLWVIFNQIESLGRHLDNAAFVLSERTTLLRNECAKLEQQEKEAARQLADTKINLVATQEEGQRTAPKSQILAMLKQRLADLRADNAKQAERWAATEQRLLDTQEALRKAEQEKEDLQMQKLELQQAMAEQALKAPEISGSKYKDQIHELEQREERLTQELQQKELELQNVQMALDSVTQQFDAYKSQHASSSSDMASKCHNLELQLLEMQREAEYQKEQAEIVRNELQTKCDQDLELQEQNKALLQEVLLLKEDQERRVLLALQAAKEDRSNLVAQHRGELHALRQQQEKQMTQLQADYRASQQNEEQLQQQIRGLQKQLEDKVMSIKDLQLKIEALEKLKPVLNAEADATQARQKAAQLHAMEQEMIGLAQRESTRTYEKRGLLEPEAKSSDPNHQYLRNVVLQYLCAKDNEIRAGLVPVLSTMFQFSPEEMQQVWKSHRQWRW